MPSDSRSYVSLLQLAHALADRSSAAILPHFRQRMAVDNKAGPGAFDPVTAADRAAEEAIRAHLAAVAPEHGIVGEEMGRREGSSLLQWVVDPIDGTRAFILGQPMWGTLIGLLEGAQPLLGLMDQPFTRERFFAAERESFLSIAGGAPERIATRPCPALADAYMTTTHPSLFAAGAEQEAFQRLERQVRMSRYGGDCYGYCLLAAGHIDLIVESGLKPYDVVALIPIIERAGGRITTWDGRPATAGGQIVAAGDARLHEAAMRVLAG